MVRAAEPARAPEGRPLLYLVAGDEDDAAAAAARVILESGLFGDELPFACDGAPVPTNDLARALDRLAASAAHRRRGGADLAAALAQGVVDPAGPVLLVVPALPGPWLPRVSSQVAIDPARFTVLAVADAAPPAPTPGLAERLLLRTDPPRARFDDLTRGLSPLVATGARLLLADRVGGLIAVLVGGEHPGAALAALGTGR
jgi:hypothetical protein